MSFDALAAAPETSTLNRMQLRQAVFGLAALGNLAAALPAAGEGERRAATDRYNAAILARAGAHPRGTMLASPVLGCGLPVGFIELLLLAAPREAAGAVEHVVTTLTAGGHQLVKDGKPVESAEALRTLVEARVQAFLAEQLPFLQLAGIAS
jgi:hypothetical protein